MINKIKLNLGHIKRINNKRNNISKNDILQNIKKINGLPISYLDEVFENIFDVIKKGLKKDGIYKISGFGTFKVLLKKKGLV